MPAVKKDLYIEQGATFGLRMTWHHAGDDGEPGDPHDLTDWSARMQIRRKQGAPPLLEATSGDGQIVLGDDTGTIEIVLTAQETDLLNAKRALYDLELVDTSGRVFRLLEGEVTVAPNITQDEGDPVVT